MRQSWRKCKPVAAAAAASGPTRAELIGPTVWALPAWALLAARCACVGGGARRERGCGRAQGAHRVAARPDCCWLSGPARLGYQAIDLSAAASRLLLRAAVFL